MNHSIKPQKIFYSTPDKNIVIINDDFLETDAIAPKPDSRMCLNIPLDKSKGRTGEGHQSIYADIVSTAK